MRCVGRGGEASQASRQAQRCARAGGGERAARRLCCAALGGVRRPLRRARLHRRPPAPRRQEHSLAQRGAGQASSLRTPAWRMQGHAPCVCPPAARLNPVPPLSLSLSSRCTPHSAARLALELTSWSPRKSGAGLARARRHKAAPGSEPRGAPRRAPSALAPRVQAKMPLSRQINSSQRPAAAPLLSSAARGGCARVGASRLGALFLSCSCSAAASTALRTGVGAARTKRRRHPRRHMRRLGAPARHRSVTCGSAACIASRGSLRRGSSSADGAGHEQHERTRNSRSSAKRQR
jgi:hypothetical protein